MTVSPHYLYNESAEMLRRSATGAAVGAAKTGRLACSGSETAMLRIAASIAEGISVDLHDAVSCLDATNLGLVLQALAHANGRPVQVAAR